MDAETIYKEMIAVEHVLEEKFPIIGIIGSGNINEENTYYNQAFEIAKHLSQEGMSILTGGGGGIMEAANRGARTGIGASIGLCLQLPNYEKKNDFIDKDMAFYFSSFFSRKAIFFKYISGLVCFPGGLGTLDELAEVLLLIRAQKIPKIPLYLIGKEFWEKFIQWMEDKIFKNNLAPQEILSLIHITDNIENVTQHLTNLVDTKSQ
jgi:hypothetical protein